MIKLGIVGYRGMVGSVLMDRMLNEHDFENVKVSLFSTSKAGEKAPIYDGYSNIDFGYLLNGNDIYELSKHDIIITCQGGDYTSKYYNDLRAIGWDGYWIDAASTLRMDDNSVIVLDPINLDIINEALLNKQKTFVGGNCTVSLMLLAIGGLFNKDLVEWVNISSYQAASGAGAANIKELLNQFGSLHSVVSDDLSNNNSDILRIADKVNSKMNGDLEYGLFGAPLAGSLIPWIDKYASNGRTREEEKAFEETNKILGKKVSIPVDSTCVRIGSLRSHSQSFTIKLKKDLPLEKIKSIIADSNQWVEVIENNKEDTLKYLSPTYTTGTLKIPVGRIRKLNLGSGFIGCFSCGDQLLWGAAEPLRRVFKIILSHINR